MKSSVFYFIEDMDANGCVIRDKSFCVIVLNFSMEKY